MKMDELAVRVTGASATDTIRVLVNNEPHDVVDVVLERLPEGTTVFLVAESSA